MPLKFVIFEGPKLTAGQGSFYAPIEVPQGPDEYLQRDLDGVELKVQVA